MRVVKKKQIEMNCDRSIARISPVLPCRQTLCNVIFFLTLPMKSWAHLLNLEFVTCNAVERAILKE